MLIFPGQGNLTGVNNILISAKVFYLIEPRGTLIFTREFSSLPERLLVRAKNMASLTQRVAKTLTQQKFRPSPPKDLVKRIIGYLNERVSFFKNF